MANIMPFGSKERDQAGQQLVEVVASVLEELVATSAANNQSQNPSTTVTTAGSTNPNGKKSEVTKFHGLKAPAISIPEYLSRISKFSGCSNPCFVLSLIYIDRLITRKRILLDPLNVHRLVITSILLAAKFFDDHYLDNAHYAAVGGIPTHEINSLEVEFSFLAEFHNSDICSFHVNSNDFEMYHSALSSKAQSQKVQRSIGLPNYQQSSTEHEGQQQNKVHQPPYQQTQPHGVAPMISHGNQYASTGNAYNGNFNSNSNNSNINVNSNGYREGGMYNGSNTNVTTHYRPEFQYQQKGGDNGAWSQGQRGRS